MKLIFLILLLNCTTISKPDLKNYIYDDVYNNYINENYLEALNLIKNSGVEDYDLTLLTASIYFKLNKFEESEFYYLKAFNKNKTEVSALNLVNIYIILNKKKSAITLLKELYLNNKLDSVYPFILGVLYKDIKDYNQSLDYFNYALNREYEPKIEIYTNILEIANIMGMNEISKKYKFLIDKANKEFEKKETTEIKKFIDLENLIKQKKYNEAIITLKKLILIKENDYKLHCLLADLYRLINELELAKDEYHKSIKYEPNYFDSHFGLIDILYSENQLQNAIIEINNSLKIFKDNPELNFYLGKIYEDLYELDKAQVYYKNSLEYNSGNYHFRKLKYADLLLKKNNTEYALTLYNELIPYFEESEISERIKICKSFQLIKEANNIIKMGNTEKGINLLKKASKLNPGLFTEFSYAKKILEIERWSEAEELLNKIYDEYNYYPSIILLKKNKLNIKSIQNIDNINEYSTILEIAEFYFEDEQFIEAIEFYKKIVQKNNNEYINKKLGYCYIYQSIIEYQNFNFDKFNFYLIEAKKILKKEDFLEKQEYVNDSILQIENEKDLKNADKLIESNKIESAINIYKKINKNINSIFLYNKITNLYILIRDLFSALEYIESATINTYKKKEIQANLYYRLEKYDKLEEICNELIQDHPELISCYTLLGKYKVENDPEDALNYFSLALSIDPNSFPSIIGKGRTLLKLNKYKDSSLEFEKAIKLNSSSFEPYFYLGIIAFREKKIYNSENYFKKSLLLNSENKEANYYLALIYYNKNNYNKSLEYLEGIKYIKEKYLDLYIRNIEKIDPNDINLEKYKSELNKVKLLNNKIDIDKTTINLIPITEKLISTPIKINKNYLLHFNNSLNLYNNKLDKIYWKINIFQKIEVIEYYNNKIYIISSNQLIQIDLETGHQDWEIYFRGDNIPKISISKNIFTLIRVNKNIYNLLKIDKTGKIINKLEVKGDYNFSIDKQGNIYLFQLEKNTLNWEILNEQFESISNKKSLFSNENREIEEIKSGDDFIIIKRGSTFYKFFNDSKIILKKHDFSKILFIRNTNHNNLFKIDDKICILNISDLSCDTFKFNLKESEIVNDNNIYSIDKKILKKINIFKNQSINYEALKFKNDSIIRVFEKIN
jgi:protein O-GlcNAc transferase